MKMPVIFASYCLLTGLLSSGCGVMSEGPAKKPPANLIATPASYYSTAKARYLGSKYKNNLDRLTEKIVRNPGTMQLQFANNISSVGGIGFFTHSATKTADERYLEVVLATPETFESKGDYSEKVNRLFSRYGQDLLSILFGDSEIFQDKELTGYGLNLHWRTVIAGEPVNRVSLARAVVYFQKERVAGFLRRGISQKELLSDAVIFAVEDDGPLQLVSYQPRENKPDSRPAIREDDLLADSSVKLAGGASPDDMAKRSAAKPVASKAEPSKKEEPIAATASKKETSPTPPSDALLLPAPTPIPGEMKSAPPAADKSAASKPVREPESVAFSIPPVEARSVKPVPEIVLHETPSQRIASFAEKEQATAQKTAPFSSKAEPVKLPTDTAKDHPDVPTVGKARLEAKSDPTRSVEDADVKTRAPVAAMTKPPAMPPIPPNQGATKQQSGIAAARPAVEPSMPTVKRSVPTGPTVPVEPKTTQLTAGAPSPDKKTTVAEAVVKSPPSEIKSSLPAERLASQTPPSAILPPLPLPASAGQTTAKSPVTETKTSTSPTRVEPSSTPPEKLPEPRSVAPTVESVSKRPLGEEKPSISPPRSEAPTAPPTKLPAEPSGASPVSEVAKPSVVEPKAASSSTRAELPTVQSAQLPERPVIAPADPLKLLPEPTRLPQNRRDAEEAVSNKFVEPATTMPAKDPSKAIKAPPSPAMASALLPRADIKSKEQVPVEPPSHGQAEGTNAVQGRNRDSAPSLAKNEVPQPITRPAPAQTGQTEKASAPAAGEQLTLLRKPVEPMIERTPVARPAPRPLQGFIIQVAFQDKQKAQSWAEKMTQRGYAVSITEAGHEGSLRVRLGNFAVRHEAERQLQNFKQEGTSGIIINLPQAFRPEAMSSVP